MCAEMHRAHYQAASAPLDEMPTLTDDGDEKSRYDFPMFFVFFISTPYLQYQTMYLLNISVYIYNGGIAAALALSGWRGWEFASLGVWVNE